MIPDLI